MFAPPALTDVLSSPPGGDLLFLQVPLLEIDGMKMVQTGAMLRYIARKASLFGRDDKESAR